MLALLDFLANIRRAYTRNNYRIGYFQAFIFTTRDHVLGLSPSDAGITFKFAAFALKVQLKFR